jgi:hypothetical protein
VGTVHAESLPPTDTDLPPTEPFQETAAGHGSIWAGYTNVFEHDVWVKPDEKKAPFGTVRLQSAFLGGSYNVADDWSINGSIRYVDNVAEQIGKPEQDVSSLQDATLGVDWQKHVGGYDITTSATATFPVRDYPTSGGAYAGQHLRQLLLGVALAHQFDFTQIYYRLGYGYAFSQKVLGFDTGYQRYDAELGWFANERFSVHAFLTGRGGFGLTAYEAVHALATGELTSLQRAQVSQHSYRAWGLGADYDFGNRYVASVSAQHTYWGANVFDAKYALEARLTRNF